MVGARNASAHGRTFAAKLAHDLIDLGYITISELARGVDASVHQANTSKQ
ncbi:MAG: DNA-processing protein DprA [Candidatus Rickettsia vulgarisii]